MSADDRLDALVAAILALREDVETYGSSSTRLAYRLLLVELGRQIAQSEPLAACED